MLFVWLAAVFAAAAADVDILPAGSLWRYNDSNADLCTNRQFASMTLDDGQWPAGAGQHPVPPTQGFIGNTDRMLDPR